MSIKLCFLILKEDPSENTVWNLSLTEVPGCSAIEYNGAGIFITDCNRVICPFKQEWPALLRVSSCRVFGQAGSVLLGILKSSQRSKQERRKQAVSRIACYGEGLGCSAEARAERIPSQYLGQGRKAWFCFLFAYFSLKDFIWEDWLRSSSRSKTHLQKPTGQASYLQVYLKNRRSLNVCIPPFHLQINQSLFFQYFFLSQMDLKWYIPSLLIDRNSCFFQALLIHLGFIPASLSLASLPILDPILFSKTQTLMLFYPQLSLV